MHIPQYIERSAFWTIIIETVEATGFFIHDMAFGGSVPCLVHPYSAVVPQLLYILGAYDTLLTDRICLTLEYPKGGGIS